MDKRNQGQKTTCAKFQIVDMLLYAKPFAIIANRHSLKAFLVLPSLSVSWADASQPPEHFLNEIQLPIFS
jgi:hypothetical protein